MDHKSIVVNNTTYADSNYANNSVEKTKNTNSTVGKKHNLPKLSSRDFSISLLGSGELGLSNVFYTLFIIMAMVFVTRSILYYGTEVDHITFTDLLAFLSNYSYSVDFSYLYTVLETVDLPDWLNWLDGIVNVITAVFRVALLICESIINIASFVGQLVLFLVGKL